MGFLKLLSILLLSINLYATKHEVLMQELSELSPKEIGLLHQTYEKGVQYDLGYTLTAILWRESHFGRYPINLGDPSFGPFHNSVKTVCSRVGIKQTKWNHSRVAEQLINDYDFAFSNALWEIQYWYRVYTDKGSTKIWGSSIKSYNVGYNGGGEVYLRHIKERIRALKAYFKK